MTQVLFFGSLGSEMFCLGLSSFHTSYTKRFSRSHPLFLQTGLIKLSPFAPSLFFSNSPSELQEYKLSNMRILSAIDENTGVPTLTPLQGPDNKKSSQQKVAAIVGGVGAALIVVVIVVLVYICLMRFKRFIKQTSDTVSSAPSRNIELERPTSFPCGGAQSPFETKNLMKLTVLEIEHATCNFSHGNIIGEGAFGTVYKGLLLDGSIVAIKRRLYNPIQNFVYKVNHIAYIQHRHIVKLIGYCEVRNQQFLAYEYISNGNVGHYLYDREGLPTGRLDMRQRLLVALGAAKGLQHLHSLDPPLLHMHFRTSNVLVDENLTAKVSDYGLSKMVTDGHRPGSSSAIDYFRDPEFNQSTKYSYRSDVYSFGVFLLEVISGREAKCRNGSNSEHNILFQARNLSVSEFVDKTIGQDAVNVAKQMMDLALLCIDVSTKRPSMASVVRVLEKIEGRYLNSELGGEIGAVTLGSELFK